MIFIFFLIFVIGRLLFLLIPFILLILIALNATRMVPIKKRAIAQNISVEEAQKKSMEERQKGTGTSQYSLFGVNEKFESNSVFVDTNEGITLPLGEPISNMFGYVPQITRRNNNWKNQ